MALRGTLKDFALPDIFQLIGMQRKTGLLTLKSEKETVTVAFENGMVMAADSSIRPLDDLLGNYLVRQGKMQKSVMDEALAKKKESMQRLVYILKSEGSVDIEILKQAFSEQVQQIVFSIFRWKSGQYDFDPTARLDYDKASVNPVGTDHILMEGIRRVDEWPIIEKRIPTTKLVLRPLVSKTQIEVTEEGAGDGVGLEASFEDLDVGRPQGGQPQSDKVVLNEMEAKVYDLLDGKRTVAAIIHITAMSDFDACRTLFDLSERNLVAPAERQQERVAAERVQPSTAASPMAGVVMLVVVLATSALGLVLSVFEPFRVPGGSDLIPTEIENFRRTDTLARMQRIDTAIRTYLLAFGDYPFSLDDLVNSQPPLVSLEDLRDNRGVAFRYDRSPERVSLEALNEMGEPYLVLMHEIEAPADAGMESVDPSQP